MTITTPALIQAHQTALERAIAARDTVGRRMDRLDRQHPNPASVEYVLLCQEIELCRVQYEALNLLRLRIEEDIQTLRDEEALPCT